MYDTSIAVGDIRYRDRGRQIISYSKLMRHRGITPTDIDGFIDYGGNGFILMEAKIYKKEIEYGPNLLIKNQYVLLYLGMILHQKKIFKLMNVMLMIIMIILNGVL